MSSDKIGPTEQATPYTPKPVGDRNRRNEANQKSRKKAKAKRRPRSGDIDDDESDDANEPGDPPHLVDIRTQGVERFQTET